MIRALLSTKLFEELPVGLCSGELFINYLAFSLFYFICILCSVLPTRIILSDSTGDYSSGDTLYMVEGQDYRFACKVPDIDPGAVFTWTVDGQDIPQTSATDIIGDNGLTTSTSYTVVVPTWAMHGKSLQCHAHNYDGHSGVSVTVDLDVQGNKLHLWPLRALSLCHYQGSALSDMFNPQVRHPSSFRWQKLFI